MQRFILVFMGLFVFLAAGCNGIQVVDNTYDSIGGKKFHVSEDYEYKGVVDAYSETNCPDCAAGNNSQNIKIRSDLFVKSNGDNKIEGFAFIERRVIGGRYYWLPVEGPRYDFEGYPYAEAFFISDGSDNYSQYYVGYLANQGYDMKMKEGVACIALERNFTKTKKGVLAQCVNTEYLPKEDMNWEEIKAFLREEFKKVYSPVE